MSIVVAILVGMLYALLGLLLALALLPFRARVAGAIHDGLPSGAARLDWGLWLLAVEIDTERRLTLRLAGVPLTFRLRRKGERAERRARRPREKRERKEPKEKEGRRGGLERLRGALAERASFRRMAARLVRALHLRLRAAGRFGIGDPADTATLYALLTALRSLPGVELEVELDWVDEVLELELEASARVWIAELLVVAVGLLLGRSSRRALRAALGWT